MMFDGILHVTLSQEKVSTTGVTQGNLELLCPNSPDSHKTQIQHFPERELIHLVDKAKRVTNSRAAAHKSWS